jgi:hypothetical protein
MYCVRSDWSGRRAGWRFRLRGHERASRRILVDAFVVLLFMSASAIVVVLAPRAEASTITGIRAIGSVPVAASASPISVNDTANLHLISHKRGTLQERGLASGTLHCPLAIELAISSSTVGIAFTCTARGGSISGTGKAAFYVSAAVAHFSGTLSVTHGTGAYVHASKSSLQIQGTLLRENYALTVRVIGRLYT